MSNSPEPHTLLALGTLAMCGARERSGNERRVDWLIERPAWALSPGQYMLAIQRQADGRYIVVIGHQDFAGNSHSNVQREDVIDLDVDDVAQDLWRSGPAAAEAACSR